LASVHAGPSSPLAQSQRITQKAISLQINTWEAASRPPCNAQIEALD